MSEHSEKDEQSKKAPSAYPPWWMCLLFLFGWLLLSVVPALLVNIGANWKSFPSTEATQIAGTVGDSFGLANSFFASAALLFVIWSIRLQQHELKIAQTEGSAEIINHLSQSFIISNPFE